MSALTQPTLDEFQFEVFYHIPSTRAADEAKYFQDECYETYHRLPSCKKSAEQILQTIAFYCNLEFKGVCIFLESPGPSNILRELISTVECFLASKFPEYGILNPIQFMSSQSFIHFTCLDIVGMYDI